ncbi:MAG TPA: XrtA/PEP-CTERM system exopolysaccharide export protein [Azospirillum sp.]
MRTTAEVAFKPRTIVMIAAALLVAACSSASHPPAPMNIGAAPGMETPEYRVGPLDKLRIFVWQAPEFTTDVPVRPDGRISTPLIDNMAAAGKTTAELGRDIQRELRQYVQDPLVTVIVTEFAGALDQKIRVVGGASLPRAIPFRANMTMLDVMIEAGGLTEYAAGNRAVLSRRHGDGQGVYSVRLADLLNDGDISANVPVMPGDVVIIPQSWF